jgi:lipopolysaccharide export system protein LptA
MRKKIIINSIILISAAVSALELINANANSNRFEDGSIISVLTGDVEFLWNDTRIFSDKTIWKRGNGHLLMSGNIRVLRDKQELRCDSAEFRSSGKTLQMRGNVFAVDSNHSATMFSGRADYFIRNDSVFLSQNPRIHFWDPSSTDTITVFGRTITYASEAGIARSADSVRIVGRDFVSVADTGYYFAKTETGMTFGEARIDYESSSSVEGDTIHFILKDNILTEFFVVGNPLGKTREKEERGDSVFMELAGDTLRFFIEDQRIKQILSENNAAILRFRQNNEEKADRMWGERILTTLDCSDCGDNNNISSIVQGNARAVYYDGNMRNESAGDTLKLFFDDDGVSSIIILGNVKGRIQE